MQQLRRDLIKKGWSIIKCKNLTDIELISKNFINELKKNITLASILKKQNIKDIAGLRKFANKLEDEKLNFIRKQYLNKFSKDIIKTFSSVLIPLFGRQVLVQKYPQIQVHVGFRNSTRTFPHSEIMAGHSPFTYNIWVPFHDIIDNSGLFIIDDKLSVKLCDEEIEKKIKNRRKLLSDYLFFPKLKFGEAIIFNPFVYHGSIQHESNKSRISLDLRVQRFSHPLFQKYNDFFTALYL